MLSRTAARVFARHAVARVASKTLAPTRALATSTSTSPFTPSSPALTLPAVLRARLLSSNATSSVDAPKAAARPSTVPTGAATIEGGNLTSLMFSVSHKPGSLQEALSFFWKHDINLTRLESRPSLRSRDFRFYVTFEGTPSAPNVRALLRDLDASKRVSDLHTIDPARVPWFPTQVRDIDQVANQVLDAGTDLESDHPGFSDAVYRERRAVLARNALLFRHGDEIPRIEYTADELRTWSAIYAHLMPLVKQHGCREHNEMLPLLEKHCGFSATNIPQIADISAFLQQRTGFTLRPVAGLLSARNFLYGLAFRIFFSTQYIRHHSRPLYTPEPDICHELMGHVPLFADPAFADFSQEIGLAAIGATDDQVLKLARCYWFSVEFGLCKENGQRKAYGAGLLSSAGELAYSMTDKPEIRAFDPFNAGEQDYPITTYQPLYYMAESFEDAKTRMAHFSESFSRPFNVRFNSYNQSIEVDRDLMRGPPPAATEASKAASA